MTRRLTAPLRCPTCSHEPTKSACSEGDSPAQEGARLDANLRDPTARVGLVAFARHSQRLPGQGARLLALVGAAGSSRTRPTVIGSWRPSMLATVGGQACSAAGVLLSQARIRPSVPKRTEPRPRDRWVGERLARRSPLAATLRELHTREGIEPKFTTAEYISSAAALDYASSAKIPQASAPARRPNTAPETRPVPPG